MSSFTLGPTMDVYIRRARRFVEAPRGRRKLLLVLVISILISLYMLPSIFRMLFSSVPRPIHANLPNSYPSVSSFEPEMANLLTPHLKLITTDDAFIYPAHSFILTSPTPSSLEGIPDRIPIAPITGRVGSFIGNGKFGLDMDPDPSHINPKPTSKPLPLHPRVAPKLLIQGRRGLEREIPFHPFVQPVLPTGSDSTSNGATILRVIDGFFHRITTFTFNGYTSSFYETFYCHRTISSLLVHELRVTNPSSMDLTIDLIRTPWSGKDPIVSTSIMAKDGTRYIMSEGSIRHFEGNLLNAFVISSPQNPEKVTIEAKSSRTFSFKHFINYSEPVIPSRLESMKPDLRNGVKTMMDQSSGILVSKLSELHASGWRHLWRSGVGISMSKADGALNGNAINSTIYFILSHTPSFTRDVNQFPSYLSDQRGNVNDNLFNLDEKSMELMKNPSRCYGGTPTILAPNLWGSVSNHHDIIKIVRLWLLTLEKNGCRNLMQSGAPGMMQAVLMSFIGMQFHQHHLAVEIHPKELHRDLFFRHIRYSKDSSFNMSTIVGEDNKANLFLSLDEDGPVSNLYACDAGCLDAPVQLSHHQVVSLPVKITDPLTPILYITSNLVHIQELKHTIHTKEVAVAPPHEHYLLNLHRYGHSLGGVALFFWTLILLLVVAFHVFLARLIYMEYCGGETHYSKKIRL